MQTSPSDVQKALKGADYPVSRDDLIELARENDASDEVVGELESGLEQESYDSRTEVMDELGGDDEE